MYRKKQKLQHTTRMEKGYGLSAFCWHKLHIIHTWSKLHDCATEACYLQLNVFLLLTKSRPPHHLSPQMCL